MRNYYFYNLKLGPLCYFNDHLLWLQDGNNAVISDMNGQGAAVISDSGLSGLYVVAIIDPTTHLQPSGIINLAPNFCKAIYNN